MSFYPASLITVLFTALLFLGCSQPKPVHPPHIKAFPEEDTYILQAIEQVDSGQFKEALKSYTILYERSLKPQYKQRRIELLNKLGQREKAEKESMAFLEKHPDNDSIRQQLVSIQLHSGKLEAALRNALALLDRAPDNELRYELVATIYFANEDYESGIRYLESAYALQNNEHVLDKLINALLIIGKKQEAISYIETHSRMSGCSRAICERLARIYRSDKNLEGMLSVLERLFDTFQDLTYAKNIVELYIYQNRYEEAIQFLEKNPTDNSLLLEIYSAQKEFGKAKNLADQLYRQTGNAEFLAKAAIYEYEFAPNKNDPKMLISVWDKLKLVNKTLDSHSYQNFLGYLLIDHELDVNEGIQLVRQALEVQPDSAYYIDSLAWGYYKLQKCEDAYRLMKRVVDMIGAEEPEVQEHWELIQKCFKEGQ